MNLKCLWILFVAVCFSSAAFSEDEWEGPKGKTRIRTNIFNTNKSEFENTSYTLSDRRFEFQLNVPVYTTVGELENAKLNSWALGYKLSQHRLTTGLLNDSTAIVAQQFLVSNMWIADSRELYILSFGGLHQKETASDVSKTYAQATFLGTHHQGKGLVYLYGIFYGSEVDGRFILLPILGLKTQLSSSWDFLVVLPLNLRFTWTMSESSKLSFYIRPDSFRYDFGNGGLYPQASQNLTLQVQRFRLGAQWSQNLSESLLMDADIGFMSQQKVRILHGEDEFLSMTSSRSAFVGLSLKYQF